ncbi:hypothetical protein [Actinophytocola gossypii]|uniref:DUF4190 domain-containing protein n=1 Tax=Actinophytocola gossypii TaxID=2812003 RepID=A0ABT2JDS4_9PSEU|nr:hypothetical protein [Actinophytocola gossypii]MCT2586022.1 hypothetical protein [Actinophytocola gossypii]
MTDDPERLVADALRAHAARTPLPAPGTERNPEPDPEPDPGTSPVLGSYGLLSGSGVTLPRQPDPTLRHPVAEVATRRVEPGGVGVGWVLLLALLLGLAAGAVVGLLTLL